MAFIGGQRWFIRRCDDAAQLLAARQDMLEWERCRDYLAADEEARSVRELYSMMKANVGDKSYAAGQDIETYVRENDIDLERLLPTHAEEARRAQGQGRGSFFYPSLYCGVRVSVVLEPVECNHAP